MVFDAWCCLCQWTSGARIAAVGLGVGFRAREFDGLVWLEGWGRGWGRVSAFPAGRERIWGLGALCCKKGRIQRGGRVGEKIVFPVFPKR